jgi:hypothetical protein
MDVAALAVATSPDYSDESANAQDSDWRQEAALSKLY